METIQEMQERHAREAEAIRAASQSYVTVGIIARQYGEGEVRKTFSPGSTVQTLRDSEGFGSSFIRLERNGVRVTPSNWEPLQNGDLFVVTPDKQTGA